MIAPPVALRPGTTPRRTSTDTATPAFWQNVPGAHTLAASRCAFCRRTSGKRLFDVDGLPVLRCPQCHLVYSEFVPNNPTTLYDRAYYSTSAPKGGYANYFEAGVENSLTFKRRLRSIEQRLGRRGRILDVGCALGDFLLVAEQAGWDAQGVELSRWAGDFARCERGLNVHTGTVETAELGEGSFDVVTLYDVIEHVPDPVSLVSAVRRVLKPHGFLHMVTPNVESWSANVLGRRWYHYKPLEHLYYFSPETITRIVTEGGLTSRECSPTGRVVTPTYVLDRLRYYSATVVNCLSPVAIMLCVDRTPLYLHTGEMQIWATRES